MFCKNCGSEIADNAVVCPNCGVQVGQLKIENTSKEMCVLAIVGFVLAFMCNIAGLICSIIAYRKCRDEGLNGKGFAIAGIAISATSMAIAVIYIIAVIGIIGCAMSMPYYY